MPTKEQKEAHLQAHKPFPQYYQTFPMERYPNLECYVIGTDKRHVVLTNNCKRVYVLTDKIVVDNYAIPRESTKQCVRCYLSDYLATLGLLLFGRPEANIKPLAPSGLVLLEDDTIICKDALDQLDECHRQQYNCIIGYGAGMMYFAGATTKQPNPAKHSRYRFSKLNQLYVGSSIRTNNHADWYIRVLRRHAVDVTLTNHMGNRSLLGNSNGFLYHCNMSDSLASLAPLSRPLNVDTELVCPRCG